jgi:hypothetical protein
MIDLDLRRSFSRIATMQVFVLGLLIAPPLACPAGAASNPTWRILRDGTSRAVAWQKHPGNPRFSVYDAETPGDPSDDAVLDQETGLVWERSPDPTQRTWDAAVAYCYSRSTGNRMGWRLPTLEELLTLADRTQANPALAAGHPFLGVPTAGCEYWSGTTRADAPEAAWLFLCNVQNVPPIANNKAGTDPVWCVRGGQGHDGF